MPGPHGAALRGVGAVAPGRAGSGAMQGGGPARRFPQESLRERFPAAAEFLADHAADAAPAAATDLPVDHPAAATAERRAAAAAADDLAEHPAAAAGRLDVRAAAAAGRGAAAAEGLAERA